MANKRNLKKNINYICNDLFSECVATALYGNKKEEDINALLTSVLIMHSDYISRVSHPEPGMEPKVYYNFIKNDFKTHVSEIIDNIANL